MDQDHLDPDELQEHHVLHDLLLELLVDHGVAAVLDHDDLPVVFLDQRQRLYDDFGPLVIGE